LKLTARVMMRPSISGNTTLIARSRGDRPTCCARQSSALPPLTITCNTGRSSPSAPSHAPVLSRLAIAKPVVLSTSDAAVSCKSCSTAARHTGSLSEATEIGSGFSPTRTSSAISVSNTARLPACKCAR
jgi:hypothetical protein